MPNNNDVHINPLGFREYDGIWRMDGVVALVLSVPLSNRCDSSEAIAELLLQHCDGCIDVRSRSVHYVLP